MKPASHQFDLVAIPLAETSIQRVQASAKAESRVHIRVQIRMTSKI